MTISAAVTNLAAMVAAIPGINEAPAELPESMNAFPMAVTYVASGNVSMKSASWCTTFPTLVVEIHFIRANLGMAVTEALPYFEPFIQAILADPKLGGAVDTIDDFNFSFGYLTWNGMPEIETIGWKFELKVKITVTNP